MDNSYRNPCTPHVQILCFFLILHSANTLITDINHHKLIYSQCSTQTARSPSHSLLLSQLFQEFTTRSSKSMYSETIVADDKTVISGLFQCRNDLSTEECKTCVGKLPNYPCRKNTQSARIHLSGCYAHYQEEEYGPAQPESRPNQLLYRTCSEHKIKKIGFEEMKNEAFSALESCVMESGNGFCKITYKSLRMVAQCTESLRACDCSKCVGEAVEVAYEDDHCRYSVSGEVYLDSCFMSYDYPKDHGFGGYSFEDNGTGDRSPKLVAIVVGGLAVVSLGLALCYFLRSCGKKKDDW